MSPVDGWIATSIAAFCTGTLRVAVCAAGVGGAPTFPSDWLRPLHAAEPSESKSSGVIRPSQAWTREPTCGLDGSSGADETPARGEPERFFVCLRWTDTGYNRLKRIQYRPDLINGFLAQTGLTLETEPP